MNDIHIGNKLIADFMGAKEDVYPESMPKWVNIFGTNEDNIKNFNYNTSWDWLMPVVEKIAIDYDFRITLSPTSLNVTYIERPDVYEGEITSMGGMTAIENTWHSVVYFIKWNLKQNKK